MFNVEFVGLLGLLVGLIICEDVWMWAGYCFCCLFRFWSLLTFA